MDIGTIAGKKLKKDGKLADLDESEREFERGDVLSGEDFNAECQALIDSFKAK